MSKLARVFAAACVILLGAQRVILAGPAVAADSFPEGRSLPDASAWIGSFSVSSSSLLPLEFTQSRVLDEGRIAGQRLLVWQVSAPLSTEQAIARIASSWQALPGTRVLEHRHGSWQVLSRLSSGRLEVVQLRVGAAQAEGFFSVWRPGQGSSQPPIAELLPQGFRSGLPLQTTEGARRVWSTSAEAGEPIASARQRLDRHLRAFDFIPSVVSDGAGEASIVRYFARDRTLTVLSRGVGSRTQFVLTLSETQP